METAVLSSNCAAGWMFDAVGMPCHCLYAPKLLKKQQTTDPAAPSTHLGCAAATDASAQPHTSSCCCSRGVGTHFGTLKLLQILRGMCCGKLSDKHCPWEQTSFAMSLPTPIQHSTSSREILLPRYTRSTVQQHDAVRAMPRRHATG